MMAGTGVAPTRHSALLLTCRSFTDHVLDYAEQKRGLKNLIQTYLATFSDLGIETWLMHGTLLGWWWNRQVRPNPSSASHRQSG